MLAWRRGSVRTRRIAGGGWLACLVLGIGLLLPLERAAAAPIALPDLSFDDVLISPNAQLSYSEFVVFSSGLDLSQLSLGIDDQGLRLVGPVSVVGAGEAELQLSYVVAVRSFVLIDRIGLSLASSIVDEDFPTFVKAEKTVSDFGGEQLAYLFTSDATEVRILSDSASFAPRGGLRVLDNLRLSSGGPGSSALFESLRNEIIAIPEPASFLLLSSGLAGLAWAGARRRRP